MQPVYPSTMTKPKGHYAPAIMYNVLPLFLVNCQRITKAIRYSVRSLSKHNYASKELKPFWWQPTVRVAGY